LSTDPFGDISIAVDSSGAVHAVQSGPGGIFYMNNWFESRRANGFSAPFQLSPNATGLTWPTNPSIAAGPDDVLHAVWLQGDLFNGNTCLYYSKKDVAGWTTPVSLVPPGGVSSWVYKGRPRVAVGKDGVLHIVGSFSHSAGSGSAHFTANSSEI